MGTPAYKAPELYLEQCHGCEVDVWSFGVIAFQLLSGNQLPFAATEEQLEDCFFDEEEELERLITQTEPDYNKL